MTNISVFESTTEKYETLLKLFIDFCVYNSEGSGLGENWFSEDWQSRRKLDLDHYLSHPDAVVHVAEIDNRIVGYSITYVCHVGGFCLLEELYIEPEFRSMGIGVEFINIIKEWCKGFGFPMKIEVYKWNENAISFYERNGFNFDSFVYTNES